MREREKDKGGVERKEGKNERSQRGVREEQEERRAEEGQMVKEPDGMPAADMK